MNPSEKYILTKQECLSKGGHVWGDDFFFSTLTSTPTKEHPQYKTCKYCGHSQVGYYPPMVWEDEEIR